jgi:hypothetical protein
MKDIKTTHDNAGKTILISTTNLSFNLCLKLVMKSLRFFVSIFLLTATTAFAQTDKIPRSQIETVLGAYAHSVGCDFEMDRKNIVETDVDGSGVKRFVALFINDDGCGGGSGSWQSNLAVLEQSNNESGNNGIYVVPEMTMPVISSIGLPRFIDRIFIKDGKLWFAGRIHDEKDGNNFPTIPVQAQTKLLKSGVAVDAKIKSTIFFWQSSKDFQDK